MEYQDGVAANEAEYVIPELDWLGVELAEALPEEFVLRHAGTAQLLTVAVD